MDKISIRFYNNKEVRAIWSDDDSRWYYSATDIVRAINNETDYVKAGNYWRWLKKKLAAQGVQPVSDTHEFKLVGPDGKKRVADVMDDNGVLLLAKHYPNNRANEFLDWFTYSDNTIDGQSKKKAYDLFESGLLNKLEPGSIKCLQQIHGYIFGGLYGSLQRCVDWSKMDKNDYLNAMRMSVSDDTEIRRLLKGALTDEIDSREMFMKGIDYSYYYEQED